MRSEGKKEGDGGGKNIRRNWIRWSWKEKRGRILGRNPDKNLKRFPPCYLQSPTVYSFALRILTQPLTFSTVQLRYTVKEKEGKPDRKPENHTPFPMV